MKNYVEMVLKTEGAIDSRIRDRLHKKENIRLLHAILGIGSEIEELDAAIINNDSINIGEEIGDILYYSGLACDELNVPFPEISTMLYQRTMDEEIKLIINTTSKLLDIIKKQIFYGKEINKIDMELGINNTIIACASLCKYFKLDIEEVKKRNIEKLQIRYKGKFNEQRAINRNLKKEYEVLSRV